MRILKHRNLLGCLFAVILAMPLIQIGVRCAYTIFNKNAKDSYSGTTTNEYTQTELTPSLTMFKIGKTYVYRNQTISYSGASNRLEIVPLGNEFKFGNATYSDINKLVWYKEGASTNYFFYYDTTNHYTNLNLNMADITFVVSQFTWTNDNFDNPMFNYFYSITYHGNYSLDNAFDYSISKITESNNIGELQFFTWFADIFLDLDNPSNALYINFINWYFNYALLVSAVYILFLALMWFIMWIRKLLERGMDFGNRGW